MNDASERAIQRCTTAWLRWVKSFGGSRPCRAWCIANREQGGTFLVEIRNDNLTLLALYRAWPERVWFLDEETELAQEAEFYVLHPELQRDHKLGGL
jgi:hypothetical protein